MGKFIGTKTAIAVIVVILGVTAIHYLKKKTLSPIVKIKNGPLQGVVSTSRDGKEIHEYYKIPFAKTPVGDLRFEPPQPAGPIDGIYDATASGPSCIQISLVTGFIEGSEDCLFVNVFTPAERKGPLPVMVYFHGGAFVAGSTSGYNPAYILDEGVILVTANYRLAALGFLTTGDGVIRGNMALKDQTMALKWTKENIEYFGGDPRKITIFGESAGAYSVGFHLLSPMSKGLFSKAIMESGSPLSKSLIQKQPGALAKQFAAKLNCPFKGSTKDMISCLRNVDAATLISSHKEIIDAYPFTDRSTMFMPTLETVQDENTFLSEEPLKVLQSGQINKVPLIIGVNEDEGLLFSTAITANPTILQRANDDWNSIFPNIFGYDPSTKDITNKIRNFYFGKVDSIASPHFLKNYTNMFSDKQFFLPSHQFAKEYSKFAPVRMYYYSYNGEFSLGNILAVNHGKFGLVKVFWDVLKRFIYRKMQNPIPNLGVCHADELQLLFNWPASSFITKHHQDYEMSRQMVKTWADFAKGSSEIKMGGLEWPSINAQDAAGPLLYLNIDSKIKLIPEPFENRVNFWKDLGF